MLKKLFVVFSFFLSFLFLGAFNKTFAACDLTVYNKNGEAISEVPHNFWENISIQSSSPCFAAGTKYSVFACPERFINAGPTADCTVGRAIAAENDEKTINVPSLVFSNPNSPDKGNLGKRYPGNWVIKVCSFGGGDCKGGTENSNILGIANINVLPDPTAPTQSPTQNTDDDKIPQIINGPQDTCVFQAGTEATVKVRGKPNMKYQWWWDGNLWNEGETVPQPTSEFTVIIPAEKTRTRTGTRKFCIITSDSTLLNVPCDTDKNKNGILLKFTPGKPEGNISCSSLDVKEVLPPPCSSWVDRNGKPISTDHPEFNNQEFEKRCVSIDTAIGPINTDPKAFVEKLVAIILSVSGGIALLLIVLSGYRMMTSQGNPEKLQGAKDSLTSAIIGLLFIILSFVILELVFADILSIPGFG